MKTFLTLLATACSGLAAADHSPVPEGIAPSDWSGIRAAHQAAKHAAQRQDDGDLVARNPAQQWSAEFDGKGFTVTPDHGSWTWGLDLAGYGERTLPSPAQLRHEGGKISCQRDENLTEWFINDSRGLEQGWDIQRCPERADPTAPLRLHLTTRGSTRPQVSADGCSVSFQKEGGGSALTYGGLKAWDAAGKALSVRFEQGDGTGFCIAVADQDARYPITIDPVAQQAYLKASDTAGGDLFGCAVAISGDTVVVGAYGESSAATGVNGNQNNSDAPSAGAAYVFVRSGTTWTQQAYLKASNARTGHNFGASVAISGDTLIVGAIYENSAASGVNGDQASTAASNAGAAYIFTRSGTTWTQQAYLKASNTEAQDQFGENVAISGDTAVVGAPQERSAATGVNGNQASNALNYAGAAYVFARSGTTWTQQAYLKASNAAADFRFGASVAVSGDTVMVGATGEGSSATGVNGNQANSGAPSSGAVYVFTRTGTTWTQEAYLKASNTQAYDSFGSSVAISGNTAAVGAFAEDSSATGVNGDQSNNGKSESGAVYVFTRSGTTWTQQAYLKASNPDWDDWFGLDVALSGDKLVVGALLEDSAATGLDGDQADNSATTSGAAYVFTREGTTWFQQAYLKASNSGADHQFGTAVAVSGDTVVVGVPWEKSAISGVNGSQSPIYSYVPGAGAAYIIVPPTTSIRAIPVTKDGLSGGGTHTFVPFLLGDNSVVNELTVGLYHLGTTDLVLTGSPAVAVTGSGDFTVTEQPAQQTVAPKGSTTFKVRFTPTVSGVQTATFSIPTNDPAQSPLTFQLAGRALGFTDDSDGDGLNDASEFKMTALNFNWQVSQPALASAYLADVNRMQLYTPAQLQALHPGTSLIAKDPGSGRFKVTTNWEKSINLADFFNFPAPAGSAVSISPSGKIEFEFDPPPDNAAFFRIQPE